MINFATNCKNRNLLIKLLAAAREFWLGRSDVFGVHGSVAARDLAQPGTAGGRTSASGF